MTDFHAQSRDKSDRNGRADADNSTSGPSGVGNQPNREGENEETLPSIPPLFSRRDPEGTAEETLRSESSNPLPPFLPLLNSIEEGTYEQKATGKASNEAGMSFLPPLTNSIDSPVPSPQFSQTVSQLQKAPPPGSQHRSPQSSHSKSARKRLRWGHLKPPKFRPLQVNLSRRLALFRKWWFWLFLLVAAGATGTGMFLYQIKVAVDQEFSNTRDVMNFNRPGTLTIKAEDGTVLQQQGPATREKVTLDQMPSMIPEAFIASEDQDFYRHTGVDYQAIIRATIANLFAGEVREGGSTITQQLTRIAFLDQERSLVRKIREAFLAQKMEQELDKKQILEGYLNLVYLGSGAYGVADAAWVYFGKNVGQLTLSETAMIAGMAPAPSVYSPLVNPELARQRRDIVLQRMVRAGYITEAERAQAASEPLALNANTPKNLYSQTPYFTSYIQQELPKYISKEQLEIGGLTIETTLNVKWQKLAEQTVRKAIADYGYGQAFEQVALVAIDPRDGEIKALVGGDSFDKSQFNRATQAQRQPGSTFKAFVYSAAIAAGFSPYRTYVDAKYVVDGYEPRNYGKNYRGSVTMKDALASSINIVAVKTLVDVGFQPVIQLAERMGIKSKLIDAYSLALGSSEVTLLELTSAYGTLAAAGNHTEAHGIVRVLDRYGKVIYQGNFKPQRAIDADSASIMTWMLEGVVNGGTGGDAALPDRQVAGKTGTSEKRRDLWFVGYIPQLVTGVWMGNDDSSPTWGASSTAAATWYDFMRAATEGMPVEKFPELPENLDDRRGTIKAQPVEPGRVYASEAAGSADYGEGSWDDPTAASQDTYYEAPADSGSEEAAAPESSESEESADTGAESAPENQTSAEPALEEAAPEGSSATESPPAEELSLPEPISEPPPSVVLPIEPVEPEVPSPRESTP